MLFIPDFLARDRPFKQLPIYAQPPFSANANAQDFLLN